MIENEFADYPVLIERYGNAPGFDNYLIWQYSDKGHVDGIDKDVDLDMFHSGVKLSDIELKKR